MAACCGAVLLGTGVASASTTPPGVHRVVASGTLRPVTAGRWAATSGPYCPGRSRTGDCETDENGEITITTDGVVTGFITFRATWGWHTNVKSRRYVAKLTIDNIIAAGHDSSVTTATFTASCKQPCTESGSVTGLMTNGASFSGPLDFTDATADEHADRAFSS